MEGEWSAHFAPDAEPEDSDLLRIRVMRPGAVVCGPAGSRDVLYGHQTRAERSSAAGDLRSDALP